MLIELIRGGATLIALCLIESYVIRYWQTYNLVKVIISGLLYGIICIIGMYAPIQFTPGVIFDARSVVLSVAGLFGGPVVAGIAMVHAGGYRLWLGGAGAGVGVGVIVSCTLLGLVYRYFHHRGWVSINFISLLGFGFVVHGVSVLWFLLLPDPVIKKLFATLILPYVTVFTLATPLLGLMLQDTRNRLKTEDALKQTSAELSESENRFRAVFDSSPNAITLKDESGQYLLVNKTYAQWHGRDVGQIIGLNVKDLFPKDIVLNSRMIEDGVLTLAKINKEEGYIPFLDGQTRHLSIYKSTLVLSPDKPAVILTILTDISHHKEMEMSLNRALTDAEYANQSKSEFLATMSHELRTPLNAILGFSDMIRLEYFGPLGSKNYADYATDIHASGDHLLLLINDILDISAIEAGKYAMNFEQVNLNDIFSECMKTLEITLSEKQLDISVDLQSNAQSLNADKRAILQIFLNLMANAVKFSDTNGAISVGSVLSGSRIQITVQNYGVIIPADILDKITEPFTKANPNPHVSQEGTGLGLAIAKTLVEAHHGSLIIESDVNRGTSVIVTLPTAVGQS